ncbi:MAG: HD domain-containing protein [Chitinivibrionales bacterium]|nr:HD domain-containing protein [Chitinivibrionales bacterium]
MSVDTVFEHVFVADKSTGDVFEEISHICLQIDSSLDIPRLRDIYDDIVRLFKGEVAGYRECNTRYHDLSHTISVFLATARLIHGAIVTEKLKSTANVVNCLVAALFHDVGFIQDETDTEKSGATHSPDHEQRSIDFMQHHLQEKDFSSQDIDTIGHIISRTILDLPEEQIPPLPEDIDLLSRILGTADLIAQMADRFYLEKLLYLYREFEEAGVRGFVSELDLLKKTESFYKEQSKKRLQKELGNLVPLMRDHFRERFGIDRNLYQEYIDKNIDYLKTILESHESDYRRMLRRGGVVASLEDELI